MGQHAGNSGDGAERTDMLRARPPEPLDGGGRRAHPPPASSGLRCRPGFSRKRNREAEAQYASSQKERASWSACADSTGSTVTQGGVRHEQALLGRLPIASGGLHLPGLRVRSRQTVAGQHDLSPDLAALPLIVRNHSGLQRVFRPKGTGPPRGRLDVGGGAFAGIRNAHRLSPGSRDGRREPPQPADQLAQARGAVEPAQRLVE
jgi:hypothetical protein